MTTGNNQNPTAYGLILTSLILLVLAVFTFLYYLVQFVPYTMDDAFITFRYSRNLAAGFGPTFNPGGPPVEGYTSFTWMILMTIPHLLKLNTVVFSKIAGVVFTLGFLILAFKFTHYLCNFLDRKSRILPASVVVFLLATFYATSFHAVAGMETAMFSFLVLLLFHQSARYIDNPTRRTAYGITLAAILAGLTRPEGNIIAIIDLVFVLVLIPNEKRIGLLKAIALGYLLPWTIYYIWRYTYYGLPLPLPAYVKIVAGDSGNFHGTREVVKFIRMIGILYGIPIIIGFFGMRKKPLPGIIGSVLVLVLFIVPYHTMSNIFRYLYPVVPMFFIIAALGAGIVLKSLEKWKPGGAGLITGSIIILVISLGIGILLVPNAGLSIIDKQNYAWSLEKCHIRLARHLGNYEKPDGKPILACADAGAIPYYSDWESIDTIGLNNAEISFDRVDVADYVISQNPDLVILISGSNTEFHARTDFGDELMSRCIGVGMELISSMQFARDYYLWLLCDPDDPLADYLDQLE
jgi:hypothetical protein